MKGRSLEFLLTRLLLCQRPLHLDETHPGGNPESETPVLKCSLCGTVFH